MGSLSKVCIESAGATYNEDYITVTNYPYYTSTVSKSSEGRLVVRPEVKHLSIRTERKVPCLGVMLVGWGGNNGSTFTAAVLANRFGIHWETKRGQQMPNWYGSLTQCSTVRLGQDGEGCDVYVPLCEVLPMVDPNAIEIDGWDISSCNLAEAVERAKVLEPDLKKKLRPHLEKLKPRPSIYFPQFIASNQATRADHILQGTMTAMLETIRRDIREMKERVDKVIVVWTANTERFCEIVKGINDTADNLLNCIKNESSYISPSTLFAVAAILEQDGEGYDVYDVPLCEVLPMVDPNAIEIDGWDISSCNLAEAVEKAKVLEPDLKKKLRPHLEKLKPRPSIYFPQFIASNQCTFINGSPQNTFVPGCEQLAERKGVFIAGDDFKTGQTKIKSVLADFLVNAGIKPVAIASYNHLGNNDGVNLSAPQQFKSKEVSKSNVIDDIVATNHILYKDGEKVDHVVVIKYVPYVGDSKRAMDEYTSEILMGGINTIVVHNTCEDSLLAVPVILDLVILAELCSRITFKAAVDKDYKPFSHILSILGYLCKAPFVQKGAPVVNALVKQRACIENILKACLGLPPEHHMDLEHKLTSIWKEKYAKCNSNAKNTNGYIPSLF